MMHLVKTVFHCARQINVLSMYLSIMKHFNPLMPKRYFYTSILFLVFRKQMLQTANTDLFNQLVPKAHKSECQNLLFPLQIKPVLKLACGVLFFAPSALMG